MRSVEIQIVKIGRDASRSELIGLGCHGTYRRVAEKLAEVRHESEYL
jgi:hypothetical protein